MSADMQGDRIARPFHVRVLGSDVLLETFDEESKADAYAANANARASELGITTRYSVVAK